MNPLNWIIALLVSGLKQLQVKEPKTVAIIVFVLGLITAATTLGVSQGLFTLNPTISGIVATLATLVAGLTTHTAGSLSGGKSSNG